MTIELRGVTYGDIQTSEDPNNNIEMVATDKTLHFFADEGETPLEILQRPEIPALGAPYSDDWPGLRRKPLSISQTGGGKNNRKKYDVVIPYETLPSTDPQDPDDTPPWKLPVFNWSLDAVDNVVPFDRAYQDGDPDGAPSKPVESSAGTPLGASKNEANLLLRFSYYLRDIKPYWVVQYRGTINEDPITITGVPIPLRQGLLRLWKPSQLRQYEEDGSLKWEYYKIDVEVEIAREQWLRELANTSLFFKSTLYDTPVRIHHDQIGKYGNNGFGSRPALVSAIRADGTLTTEEKEDLIDGVAPVDEPVTLTETGAFSFEDGKFKPIYLPFQEKFPLSWKALSMPKSREAKNV